MVGKVFFPSSPSLLPVSMQNRQLSRQRQRLEFALLFSISTQRFLCVVENVQRFNPVYLFLWLNDDNNCMNQPARFSGSNECCCKVSAERGNARKLSWMGEERAAVLLCCTRGWDDNVDDKKTSFLFHP